MLALIGACRPFVLSSYGARCAIRRADDGSCRGRPFRHDGADVGPAEMGDPVIASADGVVLAVVENRDYGVEVVVRHDRDPRTHHRYHTGYLHLRHADVRVGDHVQRGQRLGEVGLFWASDGIVHVHWRLWEGRTPIDPISKSAGCFDRTATYSGANLTLTLPLAC